MTTRVIDLQKDKFERLKTIDANLKKKGLRDAPMVS